MQTFVQIYSQEFENSNNPKHVHPRSNVNTTHNSDFQSYDKEKGGF